MELKLISYIKEKVHSSYIDKDLVHGIGDDCAVINAQKEKLLVTTDSMVQDIHFRLNWCSASLLGKKAASTSISDIAAMGGVPRWALLNLSIPRGISSKFLYDLIDGFINRLNQYNITLIGGDVTASSCALVITVTIIGTSLNNHYILRKKRFYKGDLIFCSGYLGEAAAGLLILENKDPKLKKALKRLPKKYKNRLINAFLDPTPLIDLGLGISSQKIECALIDVSDGIATELSHILDGSGFCAKIYLNKLPISRAIKEVAKVFKISPYDLAIKGGEDYQLLWIVDPNSAKNITPKLSKILKRPLSPIGKIDYGNGIWINKQNRWQKISYKGFEHSF